MSLPLTLGSSSGVKSSPTWTPARSTTVPVAVLVLSYTRISRIFCGQLDWAKAAVDESRTLNATARPIIGSILPCTVTAFAMTRINATHFRRNLDDVPHLLPGSGRPVERHDPELSQSRWHTRPHVVPEFRRRRRHAGDGGRR